MNRPLHRGGDKGDNTAGGGGDGVPDYCVIPHSTVLCYNNLTLPSFVPAYRGGGISKVEPIHLVPTHLPDNPDQYPGSPPAEPSHLPQGHTGIWSLLNQHLVVLGDVLGQVRHQGELAATQATLVAGGGGPGLNMTGHTTMVTLHNNQLLLNNQLSHHENG